MKIRTHLMFDGAAEEAMNFYVSLFPKSRVIEYNCYEAGDNKGKLQQGNFTIAGREFICIDTPIKHDFTFTPSGSIFVDCDSLADLEHIFSALSTNGEVLMPLDNYGFSTKFAWLTDCLGLSWQLNLA
jgi:predicted 3-demethylubiquinone-9 3-methyltransferase (glyoxalase superfamily)